MNFKKVNVISVFFLLISFNCLSQESLASKLLGSNDGKGKFFESCKHAIEEFQEDVKKDSIKFFYPYGEFTTLENESYIFMDSVLKNQFRLEVIPAYREFLDGTQHYRCYNKQVTEYFQEERGFHIIVYAFDLYEEKKKDD